MRSLNLIFCGIILLSNFLSAEEGGKGSYETAFITISTGDKMRFDKTEFTVAPGQAVELTLKNTGKLPKIAMGHNLVILKPGTVGLVFAMECLENKLTTGLPDSEEWKNKVIAATKMLGPGEEDTITFSAPAEGEYEFICSYPGHAAVAKGVMRVKAQ